MPPFPRLRDDLLIREQRQADGTAFVIKDPASGRFFRFQEPECFIARQLDGRTPLEVIRYRAQAKYSSDLSPETLERFIATLRRSGLLEGEGAGPGAAAGRGRVRGSILYLRFPAFDPDRLLTRLAPRTRPFFTRAFLVASALAILLALGIAVLSREEIHRDLLNLWRFDALLLAWITVLLVTAMHEFAHAFTCKHFGGEVHEMGFMLIFFQPAFYCNVSDAWLLPEKSRRLWVTFAGAYSEIFIWALATFTWRLVEPGTWIHFGAMVVMATSAIKSLFNMNPLIKLDGYYLLSDWLEIPNLRRKSLGYLGACLTRIVLGGPRPAAAATRRERRIFVTYGILAWTYSVWLLSYVSLRFGGFLIERYRGAGFLLFGGFLMALLRNPLARLGAKLRNTLENAGSGRRWRVPGRLLAGGAAVTLVLLLGRKELAVSGEFTALPLHNADIEAEVEGFVGEILVDEGDWVESGDVIARLTNRDLLAELEETEAEIEEKRAEVHTRFSQAKSAAEKAQARLEYGYRDLRRAKSLLAQGLIPAQQHDEFEEEVTVRRKELEEARAELEKLDPTGLPPPSGPAASGSRQETLALARSELARLEARKRHLEERMRLLMIVSPISGVVTSPRLQLQEEIGQFVEKGDLIAEVHELRTLMAEIAVSERDIGEVRPGQSVAVRVRAYPDRTFEGRVVSVAAAASRPGQEGVAAAAGQREKTFLVTTELDNRSLTLKPGMTGNAKIRCGKRRLLDLVSRGIARYVRVEFWSWW